MPTALHGCGCAGPGPQSGSIVLNGHYCYVRMWDVAIKAEAPGQGGALLEKNCKPPVSGWLQLQQH